MTTWTGSLRPTARATPTTRPAADRWAEPTARPGPWPKRVYLPLIASRVLYEQYGCDGVRVKKATSNATTHYIAPHYEITVAGGQTRVTKYYSFNSQRMLMRLSTGGLNYPHVDHLGSIVLAPDANGALVGNNQPRYDAWQRAEPEHRRPADRAELHLAASRRQWAHVLYILPVRPLSMQRYIGRIMI